MSKPKLTIGMATFDDFNGVYFSVQAHRMFQDSADCEFIVVDNNPDSEEGVATKNFVQSIQYNEQIRYVPFTESKGTSQTRNAIVELAEGEFVLITDPHVFLQANALRRIKSFVAEADDQMKANLFTGPLVYDGLNYVSTHFECDEFRDQMLGTWATAWMHPDGTLIVTRQVNPGKVSMRPLNSPQGAAWSHTDIPWSGHEKALMDRGYKVWGMDSNDEPFEVPGQGFGMFLTSKKDWIPFNKDFRLFGGEECVHHEVYRQAGRKTICLPFAKWLHRFGRPGGPKYPLTLEGKVRNYLLGFAQLGLDQEPIRKHFVDEVKMPQARFDMIASDPVNFTPYTPPVRQAEAMATSNLGHPLPATAQSLGDVVEFLVRNPRDLDQHVNAFMKWTLGCDTAAEITKRRESTAFLLAALGRQQSCSKGCGKQSCNREDCNRPAELYSWQEEADTLLGILQEFVKTHSGRPLSYTVAVALLDDPIPEIPKVDLLFLDTRHTGERLRTELQMYSPNVAKRILVHDTAVFGLVGENDTKGLWWAIKSFIADNPEWFVAEHTDMQYGMTVLSRVPEDKPEENTIRWPKTDSEGKPCGCGTNLKSFLKKIGIEATEGCSCNARAKAMDEQGPEWCRLNIETILDWLHEEANKRNMGTLFIRPVVKQVVYRAIRQAEKDIKSGNCY